MRRWWLAAVLVVTVLGAVQAQDVVEYRDRVQKKPIEVTGTIEKETPVGLEIQVKGTTKEEKTPRAKRIPAEDIIHITYRVKGIDALAYRKAFYTENKALQATRAKDRLTTLETAADIMRGLEKEIKDHPGASRYLQYRIARVAVLIAQEDSTKTEEAIKALEAYRAANPGGWEITLTLKELARLQEETGKFEEARKSYEALVDIPGLPSEARLESEILVSKLLLRGRKFPDAEKRLKTLEKGLPPDDPQRAYVQVYLAESQLGQNNLGQVEAQLKAALKTSVDPRLRGVVHNLLGDYFQKQGQSEEAFWHYLRVDALYNDDPEEQAKALYYLGTLFDKVKRDKGRADACIARLLEDKRLQGTTYEKLAKVNAKKP
jgi:tetratricopeptide (TPR) repeat protein